MTSPGGMEVGRISIRVLPDTSEFYRRAKKDLKEIAKRLTLDIKVRLDGSQAKAEFEKLQHDLDDQQVDMKVEADGDGVVREVRRIRQLAQKLVGAIRMTVSLNIPASIARIKTDLAIINKQVQGYRIRLPIEVVGLSKWLAILTAVSGILLSIPHLIGAIGGAVSIVGGLLATLPALAGAAAFGIGALVVGMQGFFAAVSKSGDAAAFEEELKKLTPSAQEAARALAEFREPLTDIRKAVQESLFKDMAEPLKSLKQLLPPIKSGLTGTAAGIREMTREWIKMATTQQSIDDLQIISDNTTQAFKNAKSALADFGAALRDIAVVGSSFLPGFATSVSDTAKRFADWAKAARESGRMREWIQNAIDKVKQLGRIVADIWVGFRNIFEALRGGEDTLDIIERLSQSFRDFTGAEQTQKTLKSVARVLREVIDAGTQLFGTLFRVAGDVFRELEPFLVAFAQTFAAVVSGVLEAVSPILQSIARWLSENRKIAVPLAITIVAFVTAFKGLATAAQLVLSVYRSFQTMKAAASIIGTVITSIGSLTKSMFIAAGQAITAAARFVYAWTLIGATAVKQAAITTAAWVASAIKSASFTARYYGIMAAQAVANFVKVAVSASANAIKVAGIWIAQVARMVAVTIASMATMVAAWVANWIRMAAVAMANAIRIGIAWLIALGPIALIIAAVIALAAIIIIYWDEIAAFLEMIWNWIADLATTIWTKISDFFVMIWTWISDTATSIWNGIADFFSGIWQGISDKAVAVWDYITGFLSSIWEGIKSIGESIINGLRDAWLGAIDFVKSIPGRIWDVIKGALSTFLGIGEDIINGIVQGLKNAAGAIWDFISDICSDIWNGIADFFGISSPSRLMAKGGQWIMQGLVVGMEKEAGRVNQAAANVSQGLVDSFGNAMDIGKTIADGVMTGIPDAVKAVDEFAKLSLAQVDQTFSSNLGVDNIQPIGDTLASALQGVTVQMDSRPVGKLINKNAVLQKRRG